MIPSTQSDGPDDKVSPALDESESAGVDLSGVLEESQVTEVLQQLEGTGRTESVKTRIREIAACS